MNQVYSIGSSRIRPSQWLQYMSYIDIRNGDKLKENGIKIKDMDGRIYGHLVIIITKKD